MHVCVAMAAPAAPARAPVPVKLKDDITIAKFTGGDVVTISREQVTKLKARWKGVAPTEIKRMVDVITSSMNTQLMRVLVDMSTDEKRDLLYLEWCSLPYVFVNTYGGSGVWRQRTVVDGKEFHDRIDHIQKLIGELRDNPGVMHHLIPLIGFAYKMVKIVTNIKFRRIEVQCLSRVKVNVYSDKHRILGIYKISPGEMRPWMEYHPLQTYTVFDSQIRSPNDALIKSWI